VQFCWLLNTTAMSHLQTKTQFLPRRQFLYPACFKTSCYSQYSMWVSGARFSHCFSPFRLVGPFTRTASVWPSVVEVLWFSIHIPLMKGLCECCLHGWRSQDIQDVSAAVLVVFRGIFETSETTNPATRRYIPEDVNPRYVCVLPFEVRFDCGEVRLG
jgi:hypothetical protein